MKQCQCEHESHFDPSEINETDRTDHLYLDVPAGTSKAVYVGSICDHCAETHMSDLLVK